MAIINCFSSQLGIQPVCVEIEHITELQVENAKNRIDYLLNRPNVQISDSVAEAFVELVTTCPNANPSDLWQHVIYRHLIQSGWSDSRWKRVSGFALERAFVSLYKNKLIKHNLRMQILSANEANSILNRLGITDIKSVKVDLFLEGKVNDRWVLFGGAHVKASIAERIQDDVPASQAFMQRGLLSIALTMDSKSYPPPHGNGVNYGELGGRSVDTGKNRIKRNYIEVDGQFDGLFSFNLRTPPSPLRTPSGKKIYTMSMNEHQPDQLVSFLVSRWKSHLKNIVDNT